MTWMIWLEQALLLIGLCIVCLSLLRYWRRTGDWKAIAFFWQKRMVLERNEFLINRVGLSLMILGVVIRFVYHLLFVGG
ncbi:MAG: hypothetical protein EBS77_02505 [Gammaproteobacteria bacterium]|nr:hypothetical protein [Gammaproteobacteria bacterium]